MLNLTCSCCGDLAPAHQQWSNRDTGYGLCGACAVRLRAPRPKGRAMPDEEFNSHYGVAGIHWIPLPMHIMFQRQGSSKTLRTQYRRLLTDGPGTDAPLFSAHIIDWQGKGWLADLEHNGTRYTLPHPNLDCPRELYPSQSAAAQAIAAKASELLSTTVTVEAGVELYCYPGTEGDRDLQRARYEEGSDTIRSVPENYCLISWPGELAEPRFDMDAATDNEPKAIPPQCRWRNICAAAHNAFLGQRMWERPGSSLVKQKHWLAWLISEYRKYGTDA